MDQATSTITVGMANSAEYEQVTELIDASLPGLVQSWDSRLQNLRAVRINPANVSEFLVAHDAESGELVGAMVSSFGIVTPKGVWGSSAWQHIEALAVEETHRSRGIGRQLVHKAEFDATRRGIIGMYTNTYLETPEQIRFYESCGFEIIHSKKGFDPFEPGRMQCPYVLKADVNEHIAAFTTSHGRSRGRDWFRTV